MPYSREYEAQKKRTQTARLRARGLKGHNIYCYPGHWPAIREFAANLLQQAIDTGVIPPPPSRHKKSIPETKPKKRKSWERAPDAPTSGKTWRIIFPKKTES